MKRKLHVKKGHKKAAINKKLSKHIKHDKKILKRHEHADKKLMKSIRDADHAERKKHKVSAKGMCPSEHVKHFAKKHHSKKSSKGKGKIKKVLKEFKEGKLHSGSKKGPIVKSRAQGIAIALSEARKAGAKIKKKK